MKTIKIIMFFIFAFTLLSGYSQYRRGGGDKSVAITLGGYGVTDDPMQFGINAAFKMPSGDNIKFGANLGYFWKSTKTAFGSSSVYVMPITGLFEYHFSDDDFSPYAGVDAGFYRGGTTGLIKISTTKFGVAPVFGFDYSFGSNMGLNVNLKYHHIFVQGSDITSGSLNINGGLYFSF